MLTSPPSGSLWRRCCRLVDDLAIPVPFGMDRFLSGIAARRGKRLELVPTVMTPGTPCGLLVSTGDTDRVYYAANTSPLHAEHIVLHEVGHLLFEHAGPGVLSDAAAEALLPDLSPDLIHRMLGRGSYSDDSEQEAELFASMVWERAARRPAPAPGRPRSRVDRFHAMLAS